MLYSMFVQSWILVFLEGRIMNPLGTHIDNHTKFLKVLLWMNYSIIWIYFLDSFCILNHCILILMILFVSNALKYEELFTLNKIDKYYIIIWKFASLKTEIYLSILFEN